MKSQRGFTAEEKEAAIHRIETGVSTNRRESRRFGVSESTIGMWQRNYTAFGMDGLRLDHKREQYSENQKEAAVLDYLAGAGSLRTICQKHKIRSIKQLHTWVKRYTNPGRVRKTRKGGPSNMQKGRRTTQEERIHIVQECMEQGLTYKATAKKYQVSYQQVYQWVKKYEVKGIEGLLDKRGKRKPEEEKTELEKLRAENKLLLAAKKRAELEVLFLKKMDEIERRRY